MQGVTSQTQSFFSSPGFTCFSEAIVRIKHERNTYLQIRRRNAQVYIYTCLRLSEVVKNKELSHKPASRQRHGHKGHRNMIDKLRGTAFLWLKEL